MPGGYDGINDFSFFRTGCNLLAEYIPGRYVKETVFFGNSFRLGSFTGTRRSEQRYIEHDLIVLVRVYVYHPEMSDSLFLDAVYFWIVPAEFVIVETIPHNKFVGNGTTQIVDRIITGELFRFEKETADFQ